ncbi:hypothetical protein ERJ75_001157500 [Trypanosoma vivax]|nr:hypothetical protein ERJ75_001157500 [Trypanosoma vivax]
MLFGCSLLEHGVGNTTKRRPDVAQDGAELALRGDGDQHQQNGEWVATPRRTWSLETKKKQNVAPVERKGDDEDQYQDSKKNTSKMSAECDEAKNKARCVFGRTARSPRLKTIRTDRTPEPGKVTGLFGQTR